MRRLGDILYDLIDSETGQYETYEKVTTLPDGTVIDDVNILPFVPAYRKSGTEYFKKTSLNKGTVSIRDFGVIGDGIFDDSNKLQSAVTYASANNKVIDLEGVTIGVSVNIQILGTVKIKNGTIIALSPIAAPILTIQSGDVIFDGVIIDGNDTTNFGVDIANGTSNFEFIGSRVINLNEVAGCDIVTMGLRFAPNCSNIIIQNSYFENITPIENSTPGDTQGAARAIQIRDAEKVSIDNCFFDTINGLEDGDAISVFTTLSGNVWAKSDVTVSNCKFYNVRKRGIKIIASGVNVYNNSLVSETVDATSTSSLISVFGSDVTITDNKMRSIRCAHPISVTGTSGNASNVSITGNDVILNEFDLYDGTVGSSDLSFIQLAGVGPSGIGNIVINGNKFTGFGLSVLVVAGTTINGGYISGNYFNGGQIRFRSDTIARDLKICGNTIIGSGSDAATGKGVNAILLDDCDGVYICDNTFVDINSWHIETRGGITTRGMHVQGNKVINANNRARIVREDLITSGIENIHISPGTSTFLFEGTEPPVLGTWRVGDKILNTSASDGSPIGWVCVTNGTPGGWRPFGITAGVQSEPQPDFTASDVPGLVSELNSFLAKLRTSNLLDT